MAGRLGALPPWPRTHAAHGCAHRLHLVGNGGATCPRLSWAAFVPTSLSLWSPVLHAFLENTPFSSDSRPDDPPEGDRWSTWDGATHEPKPRPDWVITALGAVTPLGGLAFLIGWICLALAAF